MHRRVILIGHMDFPGVQFEQLYFAQRGIVTNIYRPSEGEKLPERIDNFDGVIIGGGGVNMDQILQHPWLGEEVKWVEKFLQTGKPVMGFCLGTQMLAQIYGGEVKRGETGYEYGFRPVQVVEKDDVFGEGLGEQPVFHLHEYVYTLPKTAVNLLKSDQYEQQAAKFSDNVYGTQFHPEVTIHRVRQFHRFYASACNYKGDSEDFLRDAVKFLPPAHRWLKGFFDRLFSFDEHSIYDS
ncbi:MAG: type 1 glutamine amidotransferase [Alphaproteobacteria bacterium]|nr:type 1 glutamine amidotransferase [Alphaproteobacteria bacterium]MDD9919399.1 type 1 glutamine amidotransferase [Alphaproteobacteria bacterium]